MYGVEHVVDVVTADEVTDQEVQDFLHGRHVIQLSTVAMQHPPATCRCRSRGTAHNATEQLADVIW